MKRSVSLLLAVLFCFTLMLPAYAVEETPAPSMTDAALYTRFPDVTGHWATDVIKACVEYGLFGGTHTNAFSPEATMTGEMFVTVLARLSGVDTTVGDAYTVSLDWAKRQGLVDNAFVSGTPIVRQEIARLLYRYANLFVQDTEDGVNDPYTDALTARYEAVPDYADIAPEAVDAMRWTYAAAILTGDSGTGVLRPQDMATRAEAAALLVRFINACGLEVETQTPGTPAVSYDVENTIVLLYHELTYDMTLANTQPSLYVTVDEFEQQIKTLLDMGYTSLSLEELHQGKNEPGGNYFVVTFDDGYVSNYTFAFPILKQYDVSADIFINTDNILLPHHFNYEQAQEMEDSGLVRVYSHFPVHQDLRKLTRNQFIYEFTRSFQSLNTALTGERAYFFAYPYSYYDENTYQWSLELGVGMQCVQELLFDAEGLVQRVTVKHGDDIVRVAAGAPRN